MAFDYLRFLAKIGATNIHPHERRATEILIRALKLGDGQRVLELGCGTGGTIVRISGRYQVMIYGLDMLDEMLVTAEKRIRFTGLSDRVCLVKSGLSALPFSPGTFGRVYAESVLGILDGQTLEMVLEEVYRVLEDGGIFVLNDAIWRKTTSPEQAETVNRACIRDFGLPLASEAAWHIDDWQALFRRQGFQANHFLIADGRFPDNDGQSRLNRPGLLSEIFTWSQKVRGYLNRELRQQRKRYNQLLEPHRDDGKFIESRIFILSKVDGKKIFEINLATN